MSLLFVFGFIVGFQLVCTVALLVWLFIETGDLRALLYDIRNELRQRDLARGVTPPDQKDSEQPTNPTKKTP